MAVAYVGARRNHAVDKDDLVSRVAAMARPGQVHGLTAEVNTSELGAIRRWAATQPGAIGASEGVALATSELATNVTHHAGGLMGIDLTSVTDLALLAVTDQSPGLPALRDAGSFETGGRGLAIVAALSVLWGTIMYPHSKTTWAALPPDHLG